MLSYVRRCASRALEHGLLQRFLRTEVRVEPALRHMGVRRQRGKRKLLEAHARGGGECLFDDGGTGELAFLHEVENSTTGRFVNLPYSTHR